MEDKTQNNQSPPRDLHLDPNHLKDLKKSGLSEEIIRQAEIYSVRPCDINKKLGANYPWMEGKSLMAFPYPGCDGFERYKVFPSTEGQPKYLQKKDTGNHLYILERVRPLLSDPAISLTITEGEKKNLGLHQIGVVTVGLAGDWGWTQDGKPISDMNKIAWFNRQVTIVPDSDTWIKQEIQDAYYAFGMELQNRGAEVKLTYIPPGSQGEKIGVDDFLVAHGREKFEALQKINLSHRLFKKSSSWYKTWIRGKEKPPQAIDSDTIVVHPSYDINYQKCFMSIGFRKTIVLDNRPEDRNFYLISEGDRFKLTEDSVFMFNGTKIIFNDRDKILNRVEDKWNLEKISNFVCNPVSPVHLYPDIKKTLKEFLELQHEGEYGLLAAYIMATYFHRLFNAFPFLFFYGEKDSGKSRALEVCQRLCFNALKIKGVSVPSMADSIDAVRATFIMDQSESLSDPRNTELVGIIADSYTPGGGRRRVVDTSNKGRRVLEFETYCPKIFASRKMIDPDLRDRCILIHMVKAKKEYLYPEPFNPPWADLRDELYRFALMNWKKIENFYKDSGEGMAQRIKELWRPIETVLLAENVPKEESDLIRTDFLKSMEETQFELSESDHELFRALLNLLNLKNSNLFSPKNSAEGELSIKEIVDEMEPDLLPMEWKTGNHLSGRALHIWVGKKIGLFNLCDRQDREGHGGKRVYFFSPERVKDIYSRWNKPIGINPAGLDEELREIKI